MRSSIFKKFAWIGLLAILLGALLPAQAVYAEGIVGQVTSSNSSVTAGSTVTITFSAVPAVTISAYQVTVGFNTELFEYVSGSDLTGLNGSSSVDNNGSSIAVFAYGDTGIANVNKLCKITFKAKAEGQATFTTSNAVINDESPASTSVSVDVLATGATTGATTATLETTSTAQVANLELTDGTYEVVAIPQDFPTPTGFYRTAIAISGIRMEAFKATQGDLILIYLDSDAGGTNLYFYDSNANAVYLYTPFSVPGHDFVLVRPDASAIVPSGFSSTSLTINDLQINCWKKADATALDDPYYETYLLYLMDSDGQKGFFLYRPSNQFIFPYLMIAPGVDTQSETSAETTPIASQTQASEGVFAAVTTSGFNLWMIGTGIFALLSLLLTIFLIWTYFEYIRPLEQTDKRSSRVPFTPERPVVSERPAVRVRTAEPTSPAEPIRTATPVRPVEPMRPAEPAYKPEHDPDDRNDPPKPPKPPQIRRID
ncbi:MAG: hypothetical protein PHC86_04435 [Eubacteriales bacterium]|nr:hypothetical protein [Eubacteriales bacterium]